MGNISGSKHVNWSQEEGDQKPHSDQDSGAKKPTSTRIFGIIGIPVR
jgi:hypothetical protein